MDIMIAALAAAGGYLIGSLSFARIVSALAGYGMKGPENVEARVEGMATSVRLDTVSATSVSIKAGPRLGFLTYVLDVLKVFIPVFILKKVFPGEPYYLIWALAALVGHVWPVYHGFKGGGGMSVVIGSLLAIDWLAVFVMSIGGIIVGLGILRDVYLIYFSGLLLVIPWLWFRTGSVPLLLFAIAANVIFFAASWSGAKQYYRLKKTEPALRDPKTVWQFSGMGRGILKMIDKIKKKRA
jgi:glycerol-3-phosphate acyltransferase PlsY